MAKISQLSAVYHALSVGMSADLQSRLDVLPIELLSREADKKLFICLMTSAKTSPLGKKAAKIILERWKKGDIDEHLPESPVYFLMQAGIEQDIFDLMIAALDTWDYASFVYAFIHQDSSPEVEMALTRLDRAYGDQDQEVYQVLLQEIKRQHRNEDSYNHVVKAYLESKLEVVSDYAPRPKWIKSYYATLPDEGDPEMEVTEEMSIAGILPSAKDAADMILRTLEDMPLVTDILPKKSRKSKKKVSFSCPRITPEQKEVLDSNKELVREAFVTAYNIGTVEQKVALLGDLAGEISKEVLATDEKLFTILGPTNPIYGMVIDPDSDCCKYGGCRMLTCIDFENEDEFGVIDEDNPEETIEWFSGFCEYCHLKIAKKIYALRRPLTFGGWKGVFCSFKCLRAVVPLNDALNHIIINQIEDQLLSIGIQDRIVSGKDEINNEELDEKYRESTQRQIDGNFTHVTIQTIPKSPAV
uniref:Putative transmembrane protein n=1 Tax=Pithovirus LCPAC304 TaxID=2506594 RepID=A0A481ZA19_9VIRU|nr:MAG: putative transmembrane protein [Pithovirus LCPAC304]